MAYSVGKCLLRDLLHKVDMDQVELASRTNIKPQQISRYVLGESEMSLKSAKNIASVLNCHIDDLYEWIEE